MKHSADNLILCLIAALSIAAATVVARGALTRSPPGAERGFQQAVGGLGLGCQLDLTRSAWQFDPRIADDSPVLDMVPGVGQLNPWQAMALFPAPAGIQGAED